MGCAFGKVQEDERMESSTGMAAAVKRSRRPSVSAECLNDDAVSTYEKKVVEKDEAAYKRIEKSVSGNFMFETLDEKQKRDIFDAMFEKTVEKDDVVIKQGDTGDYFYVIDTGEFDVFIDGKEEVVFHYRPGGTFGELALMYNSPRAATVVAKCSGILWALDRDTFRHIIVQTNNRRSKAYENIVSSMELVKNLSDTERSTIVDALVEREFSDDEVIIKQGDTEYDKFLFYIMVQGTCKFVKDKKQVGTVNEGEYFGEKALVNPAPRAVDVIALGRVKCLAMDKATFERLMGPVHDVFHRKIETYN